MKLIKLTNHYYHINIVIMNTNQSNNINSEYFRNRFKKHDAAIKELTNKIMVPKISSRKKRNYHEAFALNPPYTRFSDELYDNTISIRPFSSQT